MQIPDSAPVRRQATLSLLSRPAQHEINNLLTVILANLDLLRRSSAEGAPRRQLERIGEATRRLDLATRAFLGLTRRVPAEPGPFAPVAAIEAIRPLLALLLPAAGAVSVVGDSTVSVHGDRAAFEDALLGCAAALTADGRLSIILAEAAPATGGSHDISVHIACAGSAAAAGVAALGGTTGDETSVVWRLPRDPPGLAPV
jgi:signal transduction histidine kinase